MIVAAVDARLSPDDLGGFCAQVRCDPIRRADGGVPFSSHGAPALHAPAACALPNFTVDDYFHDHARIENLFFDETSQPVDSCLQPDRSRLGLGLGFKRIDAGKYLVR